MARYAILGAGKQGIATGYYLARYPRTEAIEIIDQDFLSADGAISRINEMLKAKIYDTGRPHQLSFSARSLKLPEPSDSTAIKSIAELFSGFDVVISALPHSCNLAATKIAVNARVNFCDMGFDPDVIKSQLDLHGMANLAETTVLPNCGVAPGLANIIATGVVWSHKNSGTEKPIDTVKIFVGGNPASPRSLIGYGRLFSGTAEEYRGYAEILKDGKIVPRPVLSGKENLNIFGENFSAFFAQTAFGFTAGILRDKLGVKNASEKTLRYPKHYALLNQLRDLGFFSSRAIRLGNQKIVPAEFTCEIFDKNLPKIKKDQLILLINFICQQKLLKQFGLFVEHDPVLDLSAMQQATAAPVAVIARLLAGNKMPKGVFLPEDIVCHPRLDPGDKELPLISHLFLNEEIKRLGLDPVLTG